MQSMKGTHPVTVLCIALRLAFFAMFAVIPIAMVLVNADHPRQAAFDGIRTQTGNDTR